MLIVDKLLPSNTEIIIIYHFFSPSLDQKMVDSQVQVKTITIFTPGGF